jgi:integrase
MGQSREPNRLTAKALDSLSAELKRATLPLPAGRVLQDGRGLRLKVNKSGQCYWVYRFQRNKQPVELGLGKWPDVTLKQARTKALEHRTTLADGKTPRKQRYTATEGVVTWGQAVDRYLTRNPESVTQAHLERWRRMLDLYGPKPLMPLASLTQDMVIETVEPLWKTKTETASRLLSRLSKIWVAAKAERLVVGDNPADKAVITAILGKPSTHAPVEHRAAMPYAKLPEFWGKLAAKESRAANALQFTILTCVRTAEVTGMKWSEVDWEAKTWTIPASRMKGRKKDKKPHVVPLSDAALTVLNGMEKSKAPFALSENAMLYLLQRPPEKGLGERAYTVHGFRSTFTDWASDKTDYAHEVIEQALAHVVKDNVRRAYRRDTALDKRRELMQEWAKYCTGKKGSKRG